MSSVRDGTDECAMRGLFVFWPGNCVKTHKLQNPSSCPTDYMFIKVHQTCGHFHSKMLIKDAVPFKMLLNEHSSNYTIIVNDFVIKMLLNCSHVNNRAWQNVFL